MRARLALLASGVEYEHREVVLRAKPADMLVVSPKGTVPVLVLPDGQVIDQSLDIMRWALRRNNPYHWLDNAEDALKLIAQCDGDFKFHLDRYKYPNRYDSVDALVHRAKAAEFATTINAKMTVDSYAFNSILGNEYVGFMPFLRQFANTDKTWFAAQPWLALHSALADFEASAEFKTIMRTYAPWQPSATPILVNVKK